MFGQPLYIQNRFLLNFRRFPQIRRKANDFEDFFGQQFQGHYGQPQVIPVPDELDADVPRLIFDSRHGFSRIIVTQISIALTVTYSPDWQLDIALGRSYLLERVRALYALQAMLDGTRINFAGLTTRARLAVQGNEDELMALLNRATLRRPLEGVLHDLSVRFTQVVEGRYFSNLTVQNFRAYAVQQSEGVPRLSRQASSSRGLEIVGDLNDRYAYNERADYFSDEAASADIVAKGIDAITAKVEELRGLGA